jgi:hypothetical protein
MRTVYVCYFELCSEWGDESYISYHSNLDDALGWPRASLGDHALKTTKNIKTLIWKDCPQDIFDIIKAGFSYTGLGSSVTNEDMVEIFDQDIESDFGLFNIFKNGDFLQKIVYGGFPLKDAKMSELNVEGAEMDNDGSSRKDRVMDQGKKLGRAFGEGVALAAADQTGELLLDLVQKYAGAVPVLSTLLESQEGREFAKLSMALLVHTMANQTDLLPHSELIEKLTEEQIKLSTYKVIVPQLSILRQFAVDLSVKQNEFAGLVNQQLPGVKSQLVEDISEAEVVAPAARKTRK